MSNSDLNDKRIIIVDDDSVSLAPQAEGEVPVITVERDPVPEVAGKPAPVPKRRRGWLRPAIAAAAAVVLLASLYAAWSAYRHYYWLGVPVSVTPEENIAKLQAPLTKGGHIEFKADSLLGVALHIYTLRGVSASLEMARPEPTDSSVALFCRSADYKPTGEYIGTTVVGGVEPPCDPGIRIGYCGMADGRMVIGVARSEKVKDYCQERGGSFFRQFVLVSDGVLPPKFHLHGKVERRALARTADDRLCFIYTPHPETMWDFADALREYGFVDAIYITGGATPTWWRSPDGSIGYIGRPEQADRRSWTKVRRPWLVFRKTGR